MKSIIAQGAPNSIIRYIQENPKLIFDILQSLKRGHCWCEKGIGNPMMQDHSKICSILTQIHLNHQLYGDNSIS